MWFDQDDDFDDSDLTSKVDLFKTKLDVEYEPLNKLLGNNKSGGLWSFVLSCGFLSYTCLLGDRCRIKRCVSMSTGTFMAKSLVHYYCNFILLGIMSRQY